MLVQHWIYWKTIFFPSSDDVYTSQAVRPQAGYLLGLYSWTWRDDMRICVCSWCTSSKNTDLQQSSSCRFIVYAVVSTTKATRRPFWSVFPLVIVCLGTEAALGVCDMLPQRLCRRTAVCAMSQVSFCCSSSYHIPSALTLMALIISCYLLLLAPHARQITLGLEVAENSSFPL